MSEGVGEGQATTGRRLSELAEASPAHRDRYVDFLRALSVVVVVLGHWFGAVIELRGQDLFAASALDLVPGLWIITWILQIMPIFFFVGGFSNYVTLEALYRLGEGAGAFLRGRANRLLRPVAIFLAFWAIAGPLALRIPALPEGAARLAAPVLLGPLWFIVAYIALVAATPVMVRLHKRFRTRLLAILFVIPIAVDIIRFAGGLEGLGWANFFFVWLLIHQLGFFYADGTFDRVPQSTYRIMAMAGFGAMVVLVQTSTYPASMVGVTADAISNMAPPTVAIMVFGIYQVGLAMLLRPAVSRWLERKGPWKVVVALNASIMTLFLWHLSALVITAAVLLSVGFPQPPLASALWWATRPLWFGAALVVLAALVFVWGQFERPDLDPAERYWNLREFYAL